MWWPILRRFGPYLAIGVALMFVGWRIYAAGKAAERAEWEPKFSAAEKAKAEADARAEAKESLARRLSRESDERYANTVLRLNERAVDTERTMRGILRQLAASSGGEVSPASGGEPSDARTSEIERRLEAVGSSIARIGIDCELDAATVESWTERYRQERSALN
jgi:hypothetical protein